MLQLYFFLSNVSVYTIFYHLLDKTEKQYTYLLCICLFNNIHCKHFNTFILFLSTHIIMFFNVSFWLQLPINNYYSYY